MTQPATTPNDSGRGDLLAQLPSDITVVRPLARRSDEASAEVTYRGQRAAVRCSSAVNRAAAREWDALQRIESPWIARVVGWGTLGDRGIWIAREWVDGESLGKAAPRLGPEGIGRAIFDVLRALDDVHRVGLIHGDLSPNNIIVDPKGRGWLTDFGLSVAEAGSAAGRRAGTPLFIAPEVLIGAAPSASSDLFGLGATLALALVRDEVDPLRFYARFPAEDFFQAAEIDVAELPEWSRSMLQDLVSRDPARRLARRSEFESHVRSLGTTADRVPPGLRTAPAPRLDAMLGRSALAASIGDLEPGLAAVVAGSQDEARTLLDAVAVAELRLGTGLQLVDLEAIASRAETSLDLDRQVAAIVDARPHRRDSRRVVLIRASVDDSWSRVALDVLGHSIRAEGHVLGIAFLERSSTAALQRRDSPWRDARELVAEDVPSQALVDDLVGRFEVESNRDSERALAFASRVDQLAAGSLVMAQRVLRRAADLGAFLPPLHDGSSRSSGSIRLADGFDPDALAAFARPHFHGGVPSPLLDVVAVLHVLGNRARPHELCRLDGTSIEHGALQQLEAEGWIRTDLQGTVGPTAAAPAPESLGLRGADWRGLHRRALEAHARRDAPGAGSLLEPDRWVHALGASEAPDAPEVGAVLSAVAQLERAGQRARIARALERTRRILEGERRTLPAGAMVQLALAQARLGQQREAKRTAELSGRTDCQFEVEGILAHLAGRLADAAAAFDAAGRPTQAEVERAQDALDRGDLAEFERAAERTANSIQTGERGAALARIDALGLQATVAARSGAYERAHGMISEAIARAQAEDAPLLEGAMLIDAAVIERGRGRTAEALAALDRARSIYGAIGDARGSAQVQSLIGSALRQCGKWSEAEEPLTSSLVRRQRLGQHAAAATTRGIRGFLFLDRGHLRRAIDDLSLALRGVENARSRTQLAAALDFALARVGREDPTLTGEGGPATAVDARTAQWRARAAWIRHPDELTRATAWLASTDGEHGNLLAAIESDAPCDDLERLLGEDNVTIDERIELAQGLQGSGRDDAAARAAIQAAVQASELGQRETSRRARSLAAGLLERVLAGLGETEASAARRTLLGRPDPNPRVLDQWNAEDDDMDVMTILELNERLVNQEDTATLLGAIVEAGLEVTGAERGFLVLSRDGELELDSAFDSLRGEIDDEDVEYSRSIVESVLEKGSSMRVSDAMEHAELGAARSVEQLHLRSILASPFHVTPRLSGVIVVDDRTRPGAFGPREERLLELLAGQAALAIRQVHRLEQNRELAAELRRRVATQGTQLAEARRALDQASVVAPIEGLVGESNAMQTVRALIHRVAPSEIPVLVTGPSGTGKEIAARAIHALGRHPDAPFISENCAALPPSLAESELFGVTKGAFTGADVDRPGLFERAEGGTLFLDEIGELPLELQAKLLRVLETRTVRRVGAAEERPVQFRLVSATNRDLAEESDAGRFRSDLMYRVDGVRISMPPLAQRTEDIDALVMHFVALHSDGDPPRVGAEVLQALLDRPWPGNVRELSNEVRRLIVLSGGDMVDPALVRQEGATAQRGHAAAKPAGVRSIAELEREAIYDALEFTGGDKRKAAELLGISRAKVYQRLKEWEAETGE